MINVVEDTFEMRIQIIVRQNRSYDSSSSSYSSSSSSSSYSLSSPSSNESSSPSSSSSSSNESSSPINLPIVYVEIYNHRLLTLDEIFSEIQRQGLFDFYNYTNRTVTEDNYSSSQNRVGIHRIYLLLEDRNNNLSNLEIFVIVKQDRSSNDVIPITPLTFDEDEYTILDSIKVDLTNKEFMNLYRLCDYITQKRIHNFDEYLQILPIRDTYSSSELKDGTYYIDCELINVVEDTFSEFNSESNIVEISSLKAIEVNKTLTKCPFSVNGKIIVPDKTDICCMYDTCKMRCKPVFLPDKYLNGSFHIIGWFCSISCAISYNLRINDENVNKRMNLLYYLYNKNSLVLHNLYNMY